MIIDIHTHTGQDIDGTQYSFSQLFQDMNSAKITKSAVFPFNRPDSELIKESLNILDAAKNDKRIIPFLRFNPLTIQKQELKDLLSKEFLGIKLHPNSQAFFPDNPNIAWIYDLIEKTELPVIFHNSYISGESSRPDLLLPIAQRHPKMNIIIGHFLGDVMIFAEKARKYDNIFTETSIYTRKLRLQKVASIMGSERILFGSDAPFDDQEVAVLKIKKSGLKTGEIENILYNNAARLLKIKIPNPNRSTDT